MKILKKILFFVSFFFLYFLVKEFLQLYTYLLGINEVLAIIVIAILFLVVIYFGLIPIIQIFILPADLGPTSIISEAESLRVKRIKKLRGNKFLKENNFDFTSIDNSEDSYNKIVAKLRPECERIRKKYVNQVFYSTAVSQNGFLDAILIFSSAVNLVKEIFLLYHGRVNTRELFVIAKKVYYSVLIGGSEGIEYATEELFSKLATDSAKSIPFLDKIFSSLADGYINAVLLTRISLITENYCTMIYIKKDKDLYPSPSFVFKTAKVLTADIFSSIKTNLVRITKEKTENLAAKAFNPVMLVLDKGIKSIKDNKQLNSSKNAILNGVKNLGSIFKI